MALASKTQPLVTCSFSSADSHVLMRAERICKRFEGQVILNEVDLELRQGEVVLLRGQNGSGKTTLLNILTGNLEPNSGAIHYLADGSPRSYVFPRKWWQKLNPFDHFTPEFVSREGIGRTWQDVRLFGSRTLRDNIALAAPRQPGENPILALFARKRTVSREAELERDADALLAHLGLQGRESSSGDMISLGQSKRVAIARAVATGANILFLDEPLAGLDRRGSSDIIEFLKSLVGNRNLTLVIIEHVFNQSYLENMVTTDWLLERGKVKVIARSLNIEQTGRSPSAGSPALPTWFDHIAGSDSEITHESISRGAVITRIRPRGTFQAPHRPILEINNLVIKRGHRTVIGLDNEGNLTGLNLMLYKGEIAILQAPNGWGKSTLFASICGLIATSEGKICLQGQALDGFAPWERVKLGITALPSDRITFPNLRVSDAFRLGGRIEVPEALKHLRSRTCSSLSGGERQRVALSTQGQGLVSLLDEPFSGLDADGIHSYLVSSEFRQSETMLILCPSSLNQTP